MSDPGGVSAISRGFGRSPAPPGARRRAPRGIRPGGVAAPRRHPSGVRPKRVAVPVPGVRRSAPDPRLMAGTPSGAGPKTRQPYGPARRLIGPPPLPHTKPLSGPTRTAVKEPSPSCPVRSTLVAACLVIGVVLVTSSPPRPSSSSGSTQGLRPHPGPARPDPRRRQVRLAADRSPTASSSSSRKTSSPPTPTSFLFRLAPYIAFCGVFVGLPALPFGNGVVGQANMNIAVVLHAGGHVERGVRRHPGRLRLRRASGRCSAACARRPRWSATKCRGPCACWCR